MNDLAREVIERMTAQGLTLGTAESTVGGLIGHLLTDVPGSSKVFVGGITAYHGRPKTTLLNVPVETLRNAGSVSEEATAAMARGGREALQVDLCVAESGIAGPSSNPERPGGLYWIAVSDAVSDRTERHVFPGDREATKLAAAEAALRLVLAAIAAR
ncbi:MAG: CinA family protein [Dehalococcoidia bacterium]|nr:MAG: CinA family protein [Dehalococcoidia bacterium]